MSVVKSEVRESDITFEKSLPGLLFRNEYESFNNYSKSNRKVILRVKNLSLGLLFYSGSLRGNNNHALHTE